MPILLFALRFLETSSMSLYLIHPMSVSQSIIFAILRKTYTITFSICLPVYFVKCQAAISRGHVDPTTKTLFSATYYQSQEYSGS
jgi:hypothetical protein